MFIFQCHKCRKNIESQKLNHPCQTNTNMISLIEFAKPVISLTNHFIPSKQTLLNLPTTFIDIVIHIGTKHLVHHLE